jgi:hypothetical protein
MATLSGDTILKRDLEAYYCTDDGDRSNVARIQ